jgi:hypothetical protein
LVAVVRRTKSRQEPSERSANARLASTCLPPFEPGRQPHELDLYTALERIGVMLRRRDERIDMPDLFRVAAKLLKKGGTAPL